jgi:hypothetical protein
MFRQVAALPAATCLLAGGNAAALAPLLAVPLRRADDLVLEGLACLATAQGQP